MGQIASHVTMLFLLSMYGAEMLPLRSYYPLLRKLLLKYPILKQPFLRRVPCFLSVGKKFLLCIKNFVILAFKKQTYGRRQSAAMHSHARLCVGFCTYLSFGFTT